MTVITETPSEKQESPKGEAIAAAAVFKKIQTDWNLTDGEIGILLDLDSSQVEQLFARNHSFDCKETKDRMSLLIQMRATLHAIFEDTAVENRYLRAQQKMLDDRAPMDVLLEGTLTGQYEVLGFLEAAAGW